MAKVYYEPYKAIKYVGTKAKVLNTSLARPKPILKKGDIVIVDHVTAFNLVNKGFGDFVYVDIIEFVKSDVRAADELVSIKEKLVAFENENNELFAKNVELTKQLTQVKDADEASGDGE